MTGMSRRTGRTLPHTSDEHLLQSVEDILTTPLGSRVMRPGYGSEIPDLIDQPQNTFTRIRLFAASAMALLRWEPRVRLQRAHLVASSDSSSGRARLVLELLRIDLPRPRHLELALSLPSSFSIA